MKGTDQWSALMAAAQRGDEEAYRVLLESIQPVIFRYARRRLSSDAAAEDVCQETLLTMHRVRHTYEPQRPFEPWMYSIAKSRLIDHLRKQRRLQAWELATETLPDVADEPVGRGVDRLVEAIEALPEGQREAFEMLKLEGLSTEEAAERAGVSVSALKVRAHRAYTALKQALASDRD